LLRHQTHKHFWVLTQKPQKTHAYVTISVKKAFEMQTAWRGRLIRQQ